MNNKPLISIIVPFYNTNEKYISELLNLLKGKSGNIECVFVNDGSDEKLSTMVSNHCIENNFKYIAYSPNKGVSHARNIGLLNSCGKYVLFVDSDDLINIKLLNLIALNNLDKDLYLYKDCVILDDKPEIPNKELSVLDVNAELPELFCKNNMKLAMRAVWNKLLKRKIIEDFNIRFNEKLKFYEDSLFMSLFYKHTNSFVAYDNILYFYRIYNNSSSRRYNKDYMNFFEEYFYEFKKNNSSQYMLMGLYKDTIKTVIVDKTVLALKKAKFLHMYKIVRYNCVKESAIHLLSDSNHFTRKLSKLICKKHFICVTNKIIFHQIRTYLLFLLNKISKKSKI